MNYFTKIKILLLLCMLFPLVSQAQETDSTAVEPDDDEDFSQYANMGFADGSGAKEFCTSKILAQTPNQLIAIGYDVFGPYALNSQLDAGNLTSDASLSHGLRITSNFPVVSTNKILFSLGGSYLEQHYVWNNAESGNDNPMYQTLSNGSIRNLSAVATLFKPFDSKNFILAQGQGDYAGDWNFVRWQNPRYIKWSLTALYGRKVSPRFIWGIGASRTYRAGELNYVPVFMFNYTAASEKWGTEILAPAYAYFRYNFTKRSILRLGVGLEGTSYRLNDQQDFFANYPQWTGQELDQLELRRSDIRIAALWDFSVKNFYWLSLSAGYRLVYRYNVDQGEIYRGFGLVSDAPYVLENDMGGAVFVSVVVALVSP